MIKDLNDCKMNKRKWYCFKAEGKKFKKIIAHNGLVLGEGWALVVQNFKFRTNEYRKQKR